MPEEFSRPKVWRYPKLLSEHAFDKLRLLDCTFAEFEAAIEHAEIIEGQVVDDAGSLKELVLVVDWTRPLHLVVVVDRCASERRYEDVVACLRGGRAAGDLLPAAAHAP